MKCLSCPQEFKDFVLLCNLIEAFPGIKPSNLYYHSGGLKTVRAYAFQDINKAHLDLCTRVLKPQIRLANVNSPRLIGFT